MSRNWDHVLFENVRTGNLPYIQKAVTCGADVNSTTFDSNTPLANATKRGRLDIMHYLLTHKADIFKSGPNGKSPLSWAIYRGHLGAVKLLLSNGTNVNTIDVNGNTALTYACREGKTSIAEYLISKGADVNKSSVEGSTPLVTAVNAGHLPIVKLLANKGAAVDKLVHDNTALATAVKYKYTEIVKFLIMVEADVCKCGSKGKPPLSWAVVNEDLDMVQFLLENGAQTSIQMAFMQAIQGGISEMVEFLREQGADVNFVYKDGQRPLDVALKTGNLEIINYLEEFRDTGNSGSKSDGSFCQNLSQ